MKSLLIFFTIVVSQGFVIIPENEHYKHKETAILDAKEGNLLFFTDADGKALTIEDTKNDLFKNYDKTPNNFVTKTFEITFKVNEKSNQFYLAKEIENIVLQKSK